MPHEWLPFPGRDRECPALSSAFDRPAHSYPYARPIPCGRCAWQHVTCSIARAGQGCCVVARASRPWAGADREWASLSRAAWCPESAAAKSRWTSWPRRPADRPPRATPRIQANPDSPSLARKSPTIQSPDRRRNGCRCSCDNWRWDD